MKKKTVFVEEAEEYLRGETFPAEKILALAKLLKKENAFRYARRILGKVLRNKKLVLDKDLRAELFQQHALCTYKDADLPVTERLEKAFKILKNGEIGRGETLEGTKDQETLGQAGAICKRQWQQTGQRQWLERSLAYYMRGYNEFAGGETGDWGYTGINAAFVLDLLASCEEEESESAGVQSDSAGERREEAKKIRKKLSEELPGLSTISENVWLNEAWWYLVTIAEAHFGLKNYEEAREWLAKALELRETQGLARAKAIAKTGSTNEDKAFREAYAMDHVPEWEYESTARQLASLALLVESDSVEELKKSKAWEVLSEFLGGNEAAVESVATGKVGIGLSGGGFRASLFHIGVLAKMAELDQLRHLEVLSCVSGGSIIGAHYYLELRDLLESKADEDIDRQDYIDLVKRVEKDFVAGVQKNIRTRVAAEFVTNLKMIFKKNYSRTERLGELYEKHLFSRTIRSEDGQKQANQEADDSFWLNKLFVHPMGGNGKQNEGFTPRSDNWKRRNKVPTLILNATSLNTGHNWQFTASWMGEPPTPIDTEIDSNYRLRRMYYEDAPDDYKNVRLGHAVAASSCVPGLFEPLALPDLYERRPELIETKAEEKLVRPVVRLVDGGVNDNQGVIGLLEQDCQVMIVSDASGQMGIQDIPSAGLLGVPLRSNSVLMARVRQAEYGDLKARLSSRLLRGFVFLHMKKDLRSDPVDWVGTKDPYRASGEAADAGQKDQLTYYGVERKVQDQLSSLRTDLDSFTDVEASSLMASAYLMAGKDFADPVQSKGLPMGSSATNTEPVSWDFLRVKTLVNGSAKTTGKEQFGKLLTVGSSAAFKIWKLSPTLKGIGIAIGLGALGVLFWAGFGKYSEMPLLKLSAVASFIALTLVGVVLSKVFGNKVSAGIIKAARPRDTIGGVVKGVAMALGGFLIARLHVHVFDKWFKERGKVERIL